MMPVLTSRELNILVIAAFLCGLLLGIVYDLFRIIRVFVFSNKKNKARRIIFHILLFLFDFLFCLVATSFAVIVFSAYGGGQVRIIALISMVFGWGLWYKTVGRFTYRFALWLKVFLQKTVGFIYRHTIRHLVRLANKLYTSAQNKHNENIKRKYHLQRKADVEQFVVKGRTDNKKKG